MHNFPTGDVHPNPGVDLFDVIFILRYVVGLEEPTPDEFARANLFPGDIPDPVPGPYQPEPDCNLDIFDVVAALRVSLGQWILP